MKKKCLLKKTHKSLNNGPEEKDLGEVPDKECITVPIVDENKDNEMCKINPKIV